jgi:hypothetical protein
MAKLVVLITPQISEGQAIGDAWIEAGAPGVTFLEGYGIHHLRQATRNAEILTGTISMLEVLRQNNTTNLVALSVVEDEAVVTKMFAIAQDVLKDLTAPNKGLVFALDIAQVVGVRYHDGESKK